MPLLGCESSASRSVSAVEVEGIAMSSLITSP